MQTTHVHRSIALAALLALSSCGGGGSERQPEYPATADTDQSADEMGLASGETTDAPPEGDEAVAVAAPPPVMVVAGDHTPIEGATPL